MIRLIVARQPAPSSSAEAKEQINFNPGSSSKKPLRYKAPRDVTGMGPPCLDPHDFASLMCNRVGTFQPVTSLSVCLLHAAGLNPSLDKDSVRSHANANWTHADVTVDVPKSSP